MSKRMPCGLIKREYEPPNIVDAYQINIYGNPENAEFKHRLLLAFVEEIENIKEGGRR